MSADLGKLATSWYWLDNQGIAHRATDDELYARLSAGEISSSALVWHEGWYSWLPASRVGPLAWALPPGQAERPVTPKAGRPGAIPPAVPGAADSSRNREPASVDGFGLPPLKREEAPRLSEQEVLDLAVTARYRATTRAGPSGPVHPAAHRELASPDSNPSSRPVHASVAPAPGAPTPVQLASPTPQSSALNQQPTLAVVKPVAAGNAVAKFVVPGSPSAPEQLAPAAAAVARALPDQREQSSVMEPDWRGRRHRRVWLALPALGAAAIGYLALSGPPAEGFPASDPLSAVNTPLPTEIARLEQQPMSPSRCTITGGPKQLAKWAIAKAPLQIAAIPGERAVLLGYTQADRYAVGARVGLDDLEFKPVYHAFKSGSIDSVVPLSTNPVTFAVQHSGQALQTARAVNADLKVGIWGKHLALQSSEAVRRNLWLLPTAQISLPTVLASGEGFLVAFRTEVRLGGVVVGKLDSAREPLGELQELAFDDASGLPDLARAGAVQALVTAHGSPGRERLGLVTFQAGQPARYGEPWPVSTSHISQLDPRIAGDDAGPFAFALTWTEVSSSGQVIKFRPLDSRLEPKAEAVSVSPADALALWSAVHYVGGRVFVAYINQVEGHHQLWGTVLDCRETPIPATE